MSQTFNRVVLSIVVAFVSNIGTSQAEMMFKSAERTIQGSGTQLATETDSAIHLDAFTSDLLSSGYVRDESRKIIGSVSAFASQSSTLAENQIRGLARGSGFGSGMDAVGIGLSAMTVDFDIDQSMRFILTGELRLAPHGDTIQLNGSSAYIRLTGPEGVAMEVRLDEDNPPDSLGSVNFTLDNRISDIFPEGSYTLEAFAEGRGSDGKTRCLDFDFTLTAFNAAAVPEPASASLACLACLAASVLRRRRGC